MRELQDDQGVSLIKANDIKAKSRVALRPGGELRYGQEASYIKANR